MHRFILLLFLGTVGTFGLKVEPDECGENINQPLYLTSYIKNGQYKKAQELASVNKTLFNGIESYSGLFTVDNHTNSHLFFWYFPAQKNRKDAPVVLWLQGGPGLSCMVGLFTENGPFYLDNSGNLKTRKHSWHVDHHLIYIESPVGTGYSQTKDAYPVNQTQVGANLYEALLQFFEMFPELQKNEFFVTGESYAGKFVPVISHTIHMRNPGAKLKINFAGMAIGNGFSDPVHQIKYSDYLYQLGLIDVNGWKVFRSAEDKCVRYIQKKQWHKASQLFNEIMLGNLHQVTLFTNYTGFTNTYNYLVANTSGKYDILKKFLQSANVRKAIHVGNSQFTYQNERVQVTLFDDYMQSVAPRIIELLSHYKVLVYNGQLDIIVAYPLTENYLEKLAFSAADEYKKAKRSIWKVNTDIAGFVKTAGNLTYIMVRNAGHMVPEDQPEWAFDMIHRFTHQKSFN